MSKFKLSCIYLFSLILLGMISISIILTTSSPYELATIPNKEDNDINVTQKRTCIKAQKYQSKKTVISCAQKEFFSCYVDKSLLYITLDKHNITTKELLSDLRGSLAFNNFTRVMSFKGKTGIIDYNNFSLFIRKCLFCVQDNDIHDSQKIYDDSLFNSGMQSISISLKNLNFKTP